MTQYLSKAMSVEEIDEAMKNAAPSARPEPVGTTNKTFRLPNQILEILSADAEANSTTVTDLVVSILRRYVEFDREAKKFGFVTISKNTFKNLLDSLPEKKVKEIAFAQSISIMEFLDFWFEKRDINSVLAAMNIISRYQGVFEYTVSRKDNEVMITMRSGIGKKFIHYMRTAWEQGLASVLGVTPRVREGENQLTFILPLNSR